MKICRRLKWMVPIMIFNIRRSTTLYAIRAFKIVAKQNASKYTALWPKFCFVKTTLMLLLCLCDSIFNPNLTTWVPYYELGLLWMQLSLRVFFISLFDRTQWYLLIRYLSRFLNYWAHETTYVFIGNKHFFTTSCHPQTYQNFKISWQKICSVLLNKVI